MSKPTMIRDHERVDMGRRQFVGTAALVAAAAEFHLIRAATAESGKAPAGEVTVPTITLEGAANGAPHPDPSAYAAKFSGKYSHRTISGGVGHNLPQEAPRAFAQAVLDVTGL